MTIDNEKVEKHFHNLLKTVEGTGWVLCDAINYMMENDIVPDTDLNNEKASAIAQNIAELFEVISECEEPEVIEHLADKMLEYAGHGVAMANGIDEAKAVANETTLSNEEDGIGHYLNDLLNLKAI